MSILRFLLKSKTEKTEDKNEVIETAATPPPSETPSLPDALLSMPASTAEVPVQSPSSQDQLGKQLPPCVSAPSTLPDQQEEGSTSQRDVEQSSLSVVSGKEDGEKAGPSGLKTPSTSSFSATCSSTFIPFSGGGRCLGGPRTGEVGGSPASSLTLPSQSAPSAAVDSPRAKKAKPSHSSSTQVSTLISSGEIGLKYN